MANYFKDALKELSGQAAKERDVHRQEVWNGVRDWLTEEGYPQIAAAMQEALELAITRLTKKRETGFSDKGRNIASITEKSQLQNFAKLALALINRVGPFVSDDARDETGRYTMSGLQFPITDQSAFVVQYHVYEGDPKTERIQNTAVALDLLEELGDNWVSFEVDWNSDDQPTEITLGFVINEDGGHTNFDFIINPKSGLGVSVDHWIHTRHGNVTQSHLQKAKQLLAKCASQIPSN